MNSNLSVEQARNLVAWSRIVLALAHRDVDEWYQSEKIEVMLLVDSDIVHFYSNPVANPHYFGDLLGHQESEARLTPVLGAYMADALFSGRIEKPWIAPEHFREVTRAALDFATLAHNQSADALEAVSKADTESLNALVQSLQGDSEQAHEDSLTLFLGALRISKQSPPFADQAERLASWVKQKLAQPVPLESLASDTPPTLDSGSEFRWPRLDDDSAIAMVMRWKARIQSIRRKFGVPARDDRNDLADARVMTALQIVNRDWKIKKRRVHLLTGSPVLHVAALCDWQLRQSGFMHELAADFLRNPTYLLSEDELWLPIQDISGKGRSRSLSDVAKKHAAVEWLIRRRAGGAPLNLRNHRHLQAMSFVPMMQGSKSEQGARRGNRLIAQSELSKGRSSGDDGRVSLQGRFAGVLKIDISRILAGELGRSARIAISRNNLADTGVVRRNSVLKELATRSDLDVQARLKGAIEAIANEHRKTFTSDFFAASLALLEQTFITGRNKSLRGVPFVLFGRFQETRRYADMLLRDSPLSEGILAEQRQKVILEDQSCYCLVLVHALASAAYVDWAFAGKAAQYATVLAGASALEDARPEGVRGEEASYLRAVCLRHIARNVSDLNRAALELDAAEARFRPADARIQAERFALCLSGWCFRFFAHEGNAAGPTDEERRLPNDIAFWLTKNARLEIRRGLEEERKLISIELQMLTNLSISLLMMRFDPNGDDYSLFPSSLPRILEMEKWLLHFKNLISNERDAGHRISPTIEAVWTVASLAFSPEVADWQNPDKARKHAEKLVEWAKLMGSLSHDTKRIRSYVLFASRVCGFPFPNSELAASSASVTDVLDLE